MTTCPIECTNLVCRFAGLDRMYKIYDAAKFEYFDVFVGTLFRYTSSYFIMSVGNHSYKGCDVNDVY